MWPPAPGSAVPGGTAPRWRAAPGRPRGRGRRRADGRPRATRRTAPRPRARRRGPRPATPGWTLGRLRTRSFVPIGRRVPVGTSASLAAQESLARWAVTCNTRGRGGRRARRARAEHDPCALSALYHSGVVAAWRRRDRALRDLGARQLARLVAGVERGRRGRRARTGSRRDLGGRCAHLGPPSRSGSSTTLGRSGGRCGPAPVDVLDVHEEPASLAAAEVLLLSALARRGRPAVCLYSAQNIAKRYPPPFRWFERRALRRAAAVHTCNDAAGRGAARARASPASSATWASGSTSSGSAPSTTTAERCRRESDAWSGTSGGSSPTRVSTCWCGRSPGCPGVDLVIVGDGPERAAIEAPGPVAWPSPTGSRSRGSPPTTSSPRSTAASTWWWSRRSRRRRGSSSSAGSRSRPWPRACAVVASDSGSLPEVIGDCRTARAARRRDGAGRGPDAGSRDDPAERATPGRGWGRAGRRTSRGPRWPARHARALRGDGRVSLDVVVVTYNSAEHLRAALAGLPPEAPVDRCRQRLDRRLGRDRPSSSVPRSSRTRSMPASVRRRTSVSAVGTAELVLLLNPDAGVDARPGSGAVRPPAADPDLAVVSPTLRHAGRPRAAGALAVPVGGGSVA